MVDTRQRIQMLTSRNVYAKLYNAKLEKIRFFYLKEKFRVKFVYMTIGGPLKLVQEHKLAEIFDLEEN